MTARRERAIDRHLDNAILVDSLIEMGITLTLVFSRPHPPDGQESESAC